MSICWSFFLYPLGYSARACHNPVRPQIGLPCGRVHHANSARTPLLASVLPLRLEKTNEWKLRIRCIWSLPSCNAHAFSILILKDANRLNESSYPDLISLLWFSYISYSFFSIFSFGGFLDFLRFLMEQRNFSRLPHLIQRHPCTLVIMKKLSPVPRVKLILSFELERLTDEGHFEVLCLYLVYVSHV